MLQLHNLVPVTKKSKRVGRGGSRGGTSGRGHKGQGSRSGGGVRVGFEGGQMPLFRRLPKRGFTNARFKPCVVLVHTGQLEKAFEAGQTVDHESLVSKGVIKPCKSANRVFVKLLIKGDLTKALKISVDRLSGSAAKMVEKAGGEVLKNEGK